MAQDLPQEGSEEVSHGVYKKWGPEHLSMLERAAKESVPVFTNEDFTEIFRLASLGLQYEENRMTLEQFHALREKYPPYFIDAETNQVVTKIDDLYLIRLGRWAKEHAVEALKSFKNMDPHGQADWALSQLPTPHPPLSPSAESLPPAPEASET